MHRLQLLPVARIVVSLALGVLVGDAVYGSVPIVFWLSFTCVAVLFAWLLRGGTACSVALLGAVFLLGGTLLTAQRQRLDLPLTNLPIDYEAVLLSQPVQRGKVVRFDMVLTSQPRPFKVRATMLCDTLTHRYKQLRVGDGIRAFSVLEKPATAVSGQNFDFKRWLQCQQIGAQTFIYYSDWRKSEVNYGHLPIFERARINALVLRQRLVKGLYDATVEDQAASLIAAMTLGDKSGLSADTREEFSISGASHVLALSGLHLGILYMLLTLPFRRSRRVVISQMAVLVPLWCYVFLVGMPPSIVRSAVMVSIFALVSMLHRRPQPINSLAVAAVVILLFNPLSLWDVGFQMSFMAVLGILLYANAIDKLLPWRFRHYYIIRWMWAATAVSVAAQVGVAPLVAYYFGRFSVYFALTNLFVVLLAYAILVSSIVFFVLFPLPMVQSWVAMGLSWLSHLLSSGVSTIARWPLSSVENISIDALQLAACYLLIAALTLLYAEGKRLYRLNTPFFRHLLPSSRSEESAEPPRQKVKN